jgi:cytidylate kinase
MSLVVTMSGLHGTGKSSYAEILSNSFNLRHFSAGKLFRKIASEKGLSISDFTRVAARTAEVDRLVDERTKVEAKKGNVIIDGLLAGWMASEFADVNFHLMTPDDVRISRIAKRDNTSIREARKMTLFREDVERRRFKKFYGIDLDDIRMYDLILNTALLPIESNVEVMVKLIQEYIKFHGGT